MPRTSLQAALALMLGYFVITFITASFLEPLPATLVAQVLMVMIAILTYRSFFGKRILQPTSGQLPFIKLWLLPAAFGLALLMVILLSALQLSLFGIPETSTERIIGSDALLLSAASVLLVPVIEEIIRFMALKGLTQQWNLPIGLIGSTALFALPHFHPIKIIGALVLSVLILLILRATDSLLMIIIAHSTYNLGMLIIPETMITDITVSSVITASAITIIFLLLGLPRIAQPVYQPPQLRGQGRL